MLKRIIPILLLKEDVLVKTKKYKNPKYIGDPVNTCSIFNEFQVDEISILDISATKLSKEPNYNLLKAIAENCFMPASYGGGIKNIYQIEKILKIGFEKVILNTSIMENPILIKEASRNFGSQAITISIDVKKSIFNKYLCYSKSGTIRQNVSPIDLVKKFEKLGAGEILINNINREGTWKGFDIDLVKNINENCSIPVIAHGGAGSISDIIRIFESTDVSAVGLGNMVVYQKEGMGVLVNFPKREELKNFIYQ